MNEWSVKKSPEEDTWGSFRLSRVMPEFPAHLIKVILIYHMRPKVSTQTLHQAPPGPEISWVPTLTNFPSRDKVALTSTFSLCFSWFSSSDMASVLVPWHCLVLPQPPFALQVCPFASQTSLSSPLLSFLLCPNSHPWNKDSHAALASKALRLNAWVLSLMSGHVNTVH